MTKKEMVINLINEDGFVSYKAIEQLTGSKAASLFKGASLAKDGLAKATLNGVKGLVLSNKSQTVRKIVASADSVAIATLKEVTGWNAHVFGSVFRKSNLEKMGLSKQGKALVNVA